MFAVFKEKVHLASENKILRARVDFLEKERDRLIGENRERDVLWADRFLTNKVNTFAIGAEAKAQVRDKPDERLQEELEAHLDATLARLKQDAREANLPEAIAEADFAQNREVYIQQFLDNQTPYRF